MPKKKLVIDKSTLPEDVVRLKPFLGIKPGIYLAIIYSAILLVILFFVLLYSGISNPGAVFVVKTEPHGEYTWKPLPAKFLYPGAYETLS
jgi:hypothetical protein